MHRGSVVSGGLRTPLARASCLPLSGEIGLRPAWKMEMTKRNRTGGLAAMPVAALTAILLLA
jgi:hypothetical protein